MGYMFNKNYHRLNSDRMVSSRLMVDNSNRVYEIGNKATGVLKNNQWAGKPCYIIGGGDSLKNFDFNLLSDKLTIGINKAFKNFDPTIVYSMDTRFYKYLVSKELDKFDKDQIYLKWKKLKSVKIFLCPVKPYKFEPDVYLLNRFISRDLSPNLESGIYGGSNSGFGAIMLASVLGANPIYLLGYDMKLINNVTHFHGGYPHQNDLNKERKKFKSFISELDDFKNKFDNKGIKIFNVNSPETTDLKNYQIINFNSIQKENINAKV